MSLGGFGLGLACRGCGEREASEATGYCEACDRAMARMIAENAVEAAREALRDKFVSGFGVPIVGGRR